MFKIISMALRPGLQLVQEGLAKEECPKEHFKKSIIQSSLWFHMFVQSQDCPKFKFFPKFKFVQSSGFSKVQVCPKFKFVQSSSFSKVLSLSKVQVFSKFFPKFKFVQSSSFSKVQVFPKLKLVQSSRLSCVQGSKFKIDVSWLVTCQ